MKVTFYFLCLIRIFAIKGASGNFLKQHSFKTKIVYKKKRPLYYLQRALTLMGFNFKGYCLFALLPFQALLSYLPRGVV